MENITMWMSNIHKIRGRFSGFECGLGSWGRYLVIFVSWTSQMYGPLRHSKHNAGRFHMISNLCFLPYFQFKLLLEPLLWPKLFVTMQQSGITFCIDFIKNISIINTLSHEIIIVVVV